jgi:TetR/AcrR family transcriptional repressor of bet genes
MRPVRRAQVFRAATEVIAREAFSGTTIGKVAEEAGVSTGTVNHYFSNKSSMLVETLAHVGAEWNEELRIAVEQAAPGADRLSALMAAVAPNDPVNQVRWKVWIAAWSEAVASPEVRTALRTSNKQWINLLTEKLELVNRETHGPDIDGSAVARIFGALLNGLIIQMLGSDGHLDQEIPEVIHDFLFQNVGPGAMHVSRVSGHDPSIDGQSPLVDAVSPASSMETASNTDRARGDGAPPGRRRQAAERVQKESG